MLIANNENGSRGNVIVAIVKYSAIGSEPKNMMVVAPTKNIYPPATKPTPRST
jgi:hypothetical protein